MATTTCPSTVGISPSSSTALLGTKVGFVGCGTIAAAIATAVATQSIVPVESIAVSRRSVSKSSDLKEQFPDLVSVHDDNQDVVDRSDFVFVCVLPDQASRVLKELSFDKSTHNLISLVVSES